MELPGFQILQSFFIAGFWIAGATLLAEKLGSRAGGAIANLPSTILVSLVYVAIVRNPEYAAEAALAAPLGMAVNTLFLFLFIVMLKFNLIWALLTSLAFWFTMAGTISLVGNITVFFSLSFYFIAMGSAFYLLEYRLKIPSAGKQSRTFRWWALFVRALFAGTVVASTVIISTFANSFWTGIFSTFPAVMLSTMTILTISQGAKFARAVGKTMVLASINIVIYAIAIHYFYPTVGVLLGTIISFLIALLFIVLIRPYLLRMR
ncbi:DUF3147 family protein [Salinivirga cyanobacteriivorans]